jgi:hypothetical protein
MLSAVGIPALQAGLQRLWVLHVLRGLLLIPRSPRLLSFFEYRFAENLESGYALRFRPWLPPDLRSRLGGKTCGFEDDIS